LYIFIFFSSQVFETILPLNLFYSFLKNSLTEVVNFNARFEKST
jgi:hypothetical protein